ncbi:hypothetical protein [Levilactobacillus acidifarinae]|uniref:Uncharacterized protein n=1 Tax=Levilactobacillus acidifarinae DSM 19394 = JCM 15949 TaxID=1423715 RepID=A0A0R1LK81_9LACO|nr:hypothetical protein [Levilactobacillus acidifarinae]KRK96326.1 hypothetical protein FD25_GL001814 [Levilactobacillus acidifarinae DSM 19394]GEO69091.1 hypothetical protein LAC03_10010 [Levilactobacillus acidifarinae]
MNPNNYHRQISTGATRVYWQRLRQAATPVNLSSLMALTVELVFENVESVTIDAPAITEMWLLPEETATTSQDLVGFGLQIHRASTHFHAHTFGMTKPRESDGRDRLMAYQDVTQLIIHTATTDRHYPVVWNPLSKSDQENLNQHVELTADQLTLWAWPVTTNRWTDILPATDDSLNFSAMVGELTTQLGEEYDEPKVRAILTDVLTELRSFSDLAEWTTQKHLVVTYQPRQADRPWAEKLHDDTDGQDYGGLYLCSYPALLGMDVTLPVDYFWEGLAWLLWEITFSGAESVERQQNIQRFKDDLSQADREYQDFRAATAKMKRFWDAYVTHHVTAPDLAATVAHFWPLTDGVPEHLRDDANDEPVTVMRQDPQLLAEFMARFGAAYQAFETAGNQSAAGHD